MRWVSKMAAVVWRSVLFLVVCVSAGHCLYEDEIGRTDWKQSYMGGAVQAEYDESSYNNRRFVMTTTAGVLVSINTRTGKSEWSHAFSEGVDLMMHQSTTLLTYHNKQALLRSWDTETGHLEWEIVLERTNRGGSCARNALSQYCSKGVLFAVTVNKVLVTDGVTLQAVSLTDGKVSWQQTLPDGVSGTCSGMVAVDSKVYIIGTSDSALTVQEVVLSSGAMATTRNIPALWSAATSQCVIAGSTVVCVDVGRSAVFSVNVVNEEKARETSFEALSVSGDFTASKVTLSTPKPPNKMEAVVVMTTTSTPPLSWVLTFKDSTPTKAIPFDAHLVLSADNTLVALLEENKVMRVEVFSMERKERVREMSTDITLPESVGRPVKGLAHVYSRNDGSYGYRLVLFTEDDVICQVKHPDELGWMREEAPAQITSHFVWDLLQLDVPPQSADQISGPARFLQRLHYQAQRVQEFFSSLTYDGVMKTFTSTTAKVYSREEFNTKKLLLVATKSGKLFGIATEDGAFHWTRFFPDLGVYNDGSHLLFQMRDLTHPPEPPIAVLIGPGRGSCEGTLILQFNPLTGEDTEQPICEPFILQQAMPLPFMDSQHRKVLLFVTEDGRFLTYPRTEEARGIVSSSAEAVFVYFVSIKSGTLEGLQVKEAGRGRAELGSERVWLINVTAASQKIVTVATRVTDEAVNAQAKVSGGYTVLFKYLNPHLIALATESDCGDKGCVDVYVIDTVSGSIVRHMQHKQYSSPVHMVLSENWLVYYLYNSKLSRYELVVMEMYEDTTNPMEAWSSLVTHPPPIVWKQSYIFPSPVAAMTTTQTLRGITERNIIFGLQSGHLYSFPKLFLDPQRQLEPLPNEMLPPYFPEIFVNSSDYLNYNQTVTLLRSVTTHSTGLESTSIIIAYGLDLFVTVIAPSKRFDQLADDFDHQLVAMVLGALVLGAFVLSRMAHSKKLRTLWK